MTNPIEVAYERLAKSILTPPTLTRKPRHTLETHEAEMPNCSDPDCEFHHPE